MGLSASGGLVMRIWPFCKKPRVGLRQGFDIVEGLVEAKVDDVVVVRDERIPEEGEEAKALLLAIDLCIGLPLLSLAIPREAVDLTLLFSIHLVRSFRDFEFQTFIWRLKLWISIFQYIASRSSGRARTTTFCHAGVPHDSNTI